MALTLASATRLLSHAGLLREVVTRDHWTIDVTDMAQADRPFAHITYDTRNLKDGTLLCCKGRFRPEYLDKADDRGLAAYVAETEYSAITSAPGIIVNDIRKAMSLLSMGFYDHPERKLTIVGITGTKGKTTTAYFVQAMLNSLSDGKAALFSSVGNCLDGHTYVESDLTTPESMDASRMMREAVNNGMRYLVMEVSSQAYKVNRVYGLTFDVGAFLNISPDHISPLEHPTFEDYLYCKRRIVRNSRRLVLNVDCDHADLIRQDADIAHVPVTTFALAATTGVERHPRADVVTQPADAGHHRYRLIDAMNAESTADDAPSQVVAELQLAMDGDFNYANAAAAYALTRLAVSAWRKRLDPTNMSQASQGTVDRALCQNAIPAMEAVKVSGRMEQFTDPSEELVAIVDYAHNFSSVNALIDFVYERYGSRHPRISLVTGSAGNKAYDRRKEIVEAAEHRIAKFFLTVEDTDDEPVMDICRYMQRSITDPKVSSTIVDNRAEAIEQAVREARESGTFNVILIIGKGNERWIKRLNRHIPYEGDDRVVARLLRSR